MLSVVRIRPEYRSFLPSICHVDDSCRVQTVSPGDGPYRLLIERFFELTGLPILLNTSLNIRGEPMVETRRARVRRIVGLRADGHDAERDEHDQSERDPRPARFHVTHSWPLRAASTHVESIAAVETPSEPHTATPSGEKT